MNRAIRRMCDFLKRVRADVIGVGPTSQEPYRAEIHAGR